MMSHPDIVVAKKSNSPDEDKCVHDSKLLILLKSTKTFLPVTLLVITDISPRRIFL